MLHIYCYNRFEDHLKALDYIPDGYAWTEYDLTGGSEFLYPSSEAGDKVIQLYKDGFLKFLITPNQALLNHVLNYIADVEPLLPHKIFWFDNDNDTFHESVLNSQGYLNNWPFGYLH